MSDQIETNDKTNDSTDEKNDEQIQAEQKEDNLPEISVNVEEVATLKKKVTVSIPRGRIDAKFDEMFGELSRTALVPGFRVGRAPRKLIEKRFGKDLSQDVRNAVVGDSIENAITKADIETIGQPDLDLDKIELPDSGDMEYSFQVEVAPQFDLPETKGIKVQKRVMEVNDQRIDEYIDQLRQGRASFAKTDKSASDGDVVLAGATITAEGAEPLNVPGLTLRVAPGQIEGLPLVELGEKLTGAKEGDAITISTKASQAHPNENWREKDVTIELTISEVRRQELPELNDEFIGQLGFDSADDLRKFVAERMESRLGAESRRSMREQVSKFLLDNAQFDLPEGLITRRTSEVVRRRYVDLLKRGVPRQKIDENLTELQAGASDEAKTMLKLSFILRKIADEANIEVTDDEVNSQIAQIAQMNNRRPERLRQELARDGSLEDVKLSICEDRVLDKLLGEAQIEEIAEETAKTAKKTPKKAVKKASAKKPAKKTDEKAEAKPAKKTVKKTVKKTAKKAAKKTAKK